MTEPTRELTLKTLCDEWAMMPDVVMPILREAFEAGRDAERHKNYHERPMEVDEGKL